MSEVLSIIDANDYGLQQMKSEGGGSQPNLQSKDITINQNGTTSVLPDTGYDGLSDVDVTVEGVLDTSDANATSDDIRAGKTAYIKGFKVTGSIPTHTYSGSTMGGKYTIAEQFTKGTFLALGYYIAVAPAIASGYSGSNFIVDDNKLRVGVPVTVLQSVGGITADKVKAGQVIYGVTGTFTSDATATANDIVKDKTAYVNGQKITGSYEGGGGTKTALPDGIKFYNSTCNNMNWLLDMDLSNLTTFNTMFVKCSNLQTMPLLDTSNITSMYFTFMECSNLIEIPLFNTENVTNMYGLFQTCSNLVSIPVLNTSKVISMTNAFKSCPKLSNESLNNILAMCIGTTSAYTETKTLSNIGLSTSQITTCQNLSNWDAFVAAGWSGY